MANWESAPLVDDATPVGAGKPLFSLDGYGGAGMKKPGNLDLDARKVDTSLPDTYRTEESISIGTDDGEVLIPTVIDGKKVTDDEAIAHYNQTGENLGIFDTPDNADAYATALHERQATKYKPAAAWEAAPLVDEQSAAPAATPSVAAPAVAAPVAPPAGGSMDSIIAAESGGDPTAQNPNSSAGGLGQFIDSTWLDTVKRIAPELRGLSDAEIIAKKTDSSPEGIALQKRALAAFTAGNVENLKAAGIEPTNSNIYLAHFLGSGGAKTVIGADPNAPLSALLPPEVIKANPFLAKMTAADVQKWVASKMGGGRYVPPQRPQNMAADNFTTSFAMGADLPNGGMGAAPDAGQWQPFQGEGGVPIASDMVRSLYPIEQNAKTGELRMAWPTALTGFVQSVTDAIALPNDVMAGRTDPMSDEGISRALNMALTTMPAEKFPAVFGGLSKPEVLAALKEAQELGVPLTRGQAMSAAAGPEAVSQLRKEAVLRNSGVDTGAQRTMEGFDAKQGAALNAATDTTGAQFGNGAGDMGHTVIGAVNKVVNDTKGRAEAAYSRAFGSDLKIKTKALDDLAPTINMRLDDRGIYVDDGGAGSITPVAAVALKQIAGASDILAKLDPSLKGKNVTAVALRSIEEIRRRIVSLKAGTGNDNDAAALRQIKAGFDDWLDDAVDKMLITGDDKALADLKTARTEWAKYKGLTDAEPGDAAGKALEKMQADNATPEEVARWLYGADITNPSLEAPKVAAKVKQIVGPDSDAWKAVRAAAWQRLTQDFSTGDLKSAEAIAKRLRQFTGPNASSLSKVLFTKDERLQMEKLVRTIERATTKADTNQGGGSATMKKIGGNVASILALLGGGAIDPSLALPAGAIAAVGVPAAAGWLRTRAAKSATKIPKSALKAKKDAVLGNSAAELAARMSAANAFAPATDTAPPATMPGMRPLNTFSAGA